jgi:DNA (cytosine-5)-methyltransferase 1
MVDRKVVTMKTDPFHSGDSTVIKDILQKGEVPASYFIPKKDLEKWTYLKGAKSFERVSAEGYVYRFSEGGMVFPDPLDKPCRTIITGEGGASPSRFKHVIIDPKSKKHRRLTPLELERSNMFPDGHTDIDGTVSDQKRSFFMGNALVVGVIERIGIELAKADRKKVPQPAASRKNQEELVEA